MSGGERFERVEWKALAAELVIELGWTRDQVLDQIDMPFLDDLQSAWANCPPLRRMAAAYLGYKPKARPSKDYHELFALFPTGKIN